MWVSPAGPHVRSAQAQGSQALLVQAQVKPGRPRRRLWQTSGLENGRVGAHTRDMKRERYEARSLGWHVVRIDPKGTESTVEVWPEEKAKHRAAVLDQRAAESFAAERKLPGKGYDE